MARFTKERLAKRDDPIYKEGLTISTPISGRVSTPSTKNSPTGTASPTDPASATRKATRKAPSSRPENRER